MEQNPKYIWEYDRAIPYVFISGHIEYDPGVIIEELTPHYESVSSFSSYLSYFLGRKTKIEVCSFDYKSNAKESYNYIIPMLELTPDLAHSESTTPGLDRILYLIKKHLPERALQFLL